MMNTDDDDDADIIPTSELLYQRITRPTLTEFYYHSIEIRRRNYLNDDDRTVLQSVQIGDLIAIKIDDTNKELESIYSSVAFENREPFVDDIWAIGQVLSLFSIVQNDKSDSTFHAYVKWYMPLKSKMTPLVMTKDDIKILTQRFRPDYTLLEQSSIVDQIQINADTLLPGIILLNKIEPSKFTDKTCSEQVFDGCYEIPFLCRRRLDGLNKSPEIVCDDNDYEKAMKDSCVRGWDFLQKKIPDLFDLFSLNAILRNAMLQQFTIRHGEMSSSRFLLSSINKSQNDTSDESQSTEIVESGNYSKSTKAIAKTRTIQNKRSSSKTTERLNNKKKVTPKKGKKSLNKASSTLKKTSSSYNKKKIKVTPKKGKKSRNKASSTLKKTSSGDNKKKIESNSSPVNDGTELLNNKKKLTPAKKRKKEVLEKVKNTSNDNAKKKNKRSNNQTDAAISSPVGDIVFRYHELRNNKSDKASCTLLFFHSVKIHMNWDAVILKQKGFKRSKKNWIVSVGDIIAMACEESISNHPIYTDQHNNSDKKGKWFPFAQPWSPAQVLAIYTKVPSNVHESEESNDNNPDDEVYVQIRWLTRPEELSKDCMELLTDDQRKEFLLIKDSSSSSAVSASRKLYSGRCFIEDCDFVADEAPALGALGRITTRNAYEINNLGGDMMWLNNFVEDGIPTVPIICRYANIRYSCKTNTKRKIGTSKEEQGLVQTTGWSDYGSSIEGPLTRLLLYSKSYPEKIMELRRYYESFLRQKFNLDGKNKVLPVTNESQFSDMLFSQSIVLSVPEFWPDELLVWPNYVSEGELFHRHTLTSNVQREFFQSFKAKLIKRRFHSKVTGKKSDSPVSDWTVRVGDIVFVAVNGLQTPNTNNNNGKISSDSWYPFVGPWRICQIVCIYRDIKMNSKNAAASETECPLLEVRWFHRASDIPTDVVPWMPRIQQTNKKTKSEEIYESDVVESGIPLSHVLSHVNLYLGHNSEISKRIDDSPDLVLSTCRCRYVYFAKFKSFQPLFCSSIDPNVWFQRLLERGLRHSSLISQDETFSKVIECSFDINLIDEPLNSPEKEISDLEVIEYHHIKRVAQEKSGDKVPSNNDTIMFSASVVPLWSRYAMSKILCSFNDRKGLKWIVHVGDLVAVSKDSTFCNEPDTCFPYDCEYRVAQVLAIRLDGTKTVMQLRSFYRKTEVPILCNDAKDTGICSVYETDIVEVDWIDIKLLLGPVYLCDQNLESCQRVWKSMTPHLPVKMFVYSGVFDTVKNCTQHSSLNSMLSRGINQSEHYSKADRSSILKSRNKENIDMLQNKILSSLHTFNDAPSSRQHHFNSCVGIGDNLERVGGSSAHNGFEAVVLSSPFHIDHSTGCQFFTELSVTPWFDKFMHTEESNVQDENQKWIVKLGDVVVVDYEGDENAPKICKARYGTTKYESCPYWPFCSLWGVAEVVNIMKTSDLASKSITSDVKNDDRTNDIRLEIRWFYREMDMSINRRSKKDVDNTMSEEIFETDQYEEIPPSALYSPVNLIERPVPVAIPKVRMGMPVLDFFCTRFYSIARKSLLPVAGLNGRMDRGRSNSPWLLNNAALKASLAGTLSVKSISQSNVIQELNIMERNNWVLAFRKVINKLSLTDASKEASENRSLLVGREKERAQIMTFLRSSIRGHSSDVTKPSIFVSGPPGVGKTASIVAAMCELKHEQAAGKIPDFEFISLNCMEMRHPFEAYVRLWRHLTSISSPAESAASDLESFFSGGKKSNQMEGCRTIVVLLDEIDYLITKKQTVLYNFFDWPIRSFETGSKHRLIVIGVSNTLNLPERLHPRVQSRVGSSRIFFKSYNVNESLAILKSKLEQASPNYTVFDEDAILFAAKKTAALSGDIRKAFNICREAADLVMTDTQKHDSHEDMRPVVHIKDVLKVSRESSNTAHSRTAKCSSPYEVLVMIALASLSKTTGREFGGFDTVEITVKVESIANTAGDPIYCPPPDTMEILTILSKLEEADLVTLSTTRNSSMSYRSSLAGCGGAWPLASLTIDDQALCQALKKTLHEDLARKHLLYNY